MCQCQGIHVTLSREEKASARRLAGLMIPVYAVVVLAVIAVAALAGRQGAGELVASSAPPAAAVR